MTWDQLMDHFLKVCKQFAWFLWGNIVFNVLCVNERCYFFILSPTTSHFTPFKTLKRIEHFSGNFSFVAPRKKNLWAHL